MRRLWLATGTLVLTLAASACASDVAAPEAGGSQRFAEGQVAARVELVDTGLLKGSASAEANKGWKATAISVTAADHKGTKWTVLELPGDTAAEEVFEVVLQELPRGQQLTITATATFEDEAGKRMQRSVIDHWPP